MNGFLKLPPFIVGIVLLCHGFKSCCGDGKRETTIIGNNNDNNECLTSSCSAGNKTVVDNGLKWRIEEDHPCTIERLTRRQLKKKFKSTKGLVPALYPYPLVITITPDDDDDKSNHNPYQDFAYRCARENITTTTFSPDFTVMTSSSNSFSDHRREFKLVDYIDAIASKEILPHVHHANESWYLFGETYSNEWKEKLLNYYPLPPCSSCAIKSNVALSFGIGHTGSGVQWHTHGPGFVQTLHGRKHWILYEPDNKPPMYHTDLYSTRHWMEEVYTSLAPKQRPWECTLQPFDLLYFPNEWHHATLNLDPYTAFVSSFTIEHNQKDISNTLW